MVLVNLQVAFRVDRQVHHTVLANLFQHVVEESQARSDIRFACAVKVQMYINICFLRCALHFCSPFASKEYLSNLVPRHSVLTENQSLATKVFSQLAVGIAVADDVAVGKVVFLIIYIGSQHAGARFSHRRIVFREMAVDELLVESDAFAFQRLKNEVVNRPEGIFRKRVCSQAVLVTHHHEFEIELFADKPQVLKHAACEFQFLKRVNLFVLRLLNQCAVSVYK